MRPGSPVDIGDFFCQVPYLIRLQWNIRVVEQAIEQGQAGLRGVAARRGRLGR
jgi:hypothetical protein